MRLLLPLLALALALAGARAAPAQSDRLRVELPAPGRRGSDPPQISSQRVLSDSRTRDLLVHGFPARLHYRLELWSTDGWFNDLRRSVEWDVIVRQAPLDGRFLVARIVGDEVTSLGTFAEFRDVETVLARPYQPPLRPPRGERVYYVATLDVEMLSVNDLDEVERWLRGELRPAVRGERNPGTAITRGLRSLVVGLLGSENRHYQARTRTFRPD